MEDRCTRCGSTAPGRYCPVCGLDRTPTERVMSVNNRAVAQDRERQWLAAHPEAAHVKRCPDCAEEVQAAAKVCRFCSYRFDGGQSPARAPTPQRLVRPHARTKSPGGAAALGILLAGLGHFY